MYVDGLCYKIHLKNMLVRVEFKTENKKRKIYVNGRGI